MSEFDILAEVYRKDFGMFAMRFLQERMGGRELKWGWAHDLICDRLMKLERGEIKRLIVNARPRSLKSEICSVAFPAWVFLRNPGAAITSVSYEESLANAFARGTRQIMRMEMYCAIGGPALSKTQFAADEFETVQGGSRLARSVGGAITGRGGDYLIFDDLAPAREAMSESSRNKLNEDIRQTLMSRGNSVTDTRFVAVAQRLHEDDATAIFVDQGGWEHLSLPAIAVEDEVFHYDTFAGPQVHRRKPGDPLFPEFETAADYDHLIRSLGTVTWQSQYQQSPVPSAGNLVKMEWFPRFTARPATFEQVIIAWDTAAKDKETNDYSACVVFGRIKEHAWLLEVFRLRKGYDIVKAEVKQWKRRFNANIVVIEDMGIGSALIGDLQREGMHEVRAAPARRNKEIRFQAATSMMAAGNISLPEDAMWLGDFEHELQAFPVGKHDDMVDAFVHAVIWMKENPSRPHLARFYEGEYGALGPKAQALVTIQSPKKISGTVIPMGATSSISTDENGIITLPEEHARPLLAGGWVELGRTAPE